MFSSGYLFICMHEVNRCVILCMFVLVRYSMVILCVIFQIFCSLKLFSVLPLCSQKLLCSCVFSKVPLCVCVFSKGVVSVLSSLPQCSQKLFSVVPLMFSKTHLII